MVLIKNDDESQRFTRYLIPASFIPFSAFAQASKEVVERETNKKIILEEIKDTPDFLRSQCKSEHLEELGFVVDKRKVHSVLKTNAEEVFKRLSTPGVY